MHGKKFSQHITTWEPYEQDDTEDSWKPEMKISSHKTLAKKTIHTHAVQRHFATIPNSIILNRPPPEIDKTETELQRRTRRLLAQLQANKSPFLLSYLNHIDPNNYLTPSCPLCRVAEHSTKNLPSFLP